jgi:hypothetical protein
MMFLVPGLIAIFAAQDDPERLIQQLSDERAETRNRAMERLIRLGEPARSSLRRASDTGGIEERLRAAEVLKTLDLFAELKPWYGLDSRVTLKGEMTLEQASRAIGAQTGQMALPLSWPEGTFKVDMNDVPFWKALEVVAEASGARCVAAGDAGAHFTGSRWVKPISTISGPFRISASGTSSEREFNVETRSGEATLSIFVTLGWERSIRPVRSLLTLETARDDLGNDLKAGIEEYDRRVSVTTREVGDEHRLYAEEFSLTTTVPPGPAARSGTLEGSIAVYIRGSEKNLELPIPGKDGSSRASLEVLDEHLQGKSTASFVMSKPQREKTTFDCELEMKDIEARLVDDIHRCVFLTDKEGHRYRCAQVSWRRKGGDLHYFLGFKDVPESAELTGLHTVLPLRMVKKDVSFSLPGIPLS